MVAVATTDAILLTKHAKEIGVAPRAFVGFGGGFGVEDLAKELGPQSQNVFSSAAWSGNPNDPAAKEFYKKFHDKYGIWPKEHEVEGYAIVYVIADAMRRAQLTGNVDADREVEPASGVGKSPRRLIMVNSLAAVARGVTGAGQALRQLCREDF